MMSHQWMSDVPWSKLVYKLSLFLNDNNEYLAYGIGAALTLGDLNYLNADVTWGEGLLSNYSLPPDMLNQYLEIYYEAAKTHLDERGEPIITWLAQFKNGSQAEE